MLPRDLMGLVASYLNAWDLEAVDLVCNEFHDLLRQPYFVADTWRGLFERLSHIVSRHRLLTVSHGQYRVRPNVHVHVITPPPSMDIAACARLGLLPNVTPPEAVRRRTVHATILLAFLHHWVPFAVEVRRGMLPLFSACMPCARCNMSLLVPDMKDTQLAMSMHAGVLLHKACASVSDVYVSRNVARRLSGRSATYMYTIAALPIRIGQDRRWYFRDVVDCIPKGRGYLIRRRMESRPEPIRAARQKKRRTYNTALATGQIHERGTQPLPVPFACRPPCGIALCCGGTPRMKAEP
jgi:hypothetical protein